MWGSELAAITFEGRTLGADRSLKEDVGRLLHGESRPPRSQDQFVHQWLARAWRAQDSDGRNQLAAAIGAHLAVEAVGARSEAIRFFQTERAADDAGALLVALSSAQELFEGVVDPLPGAPGDLQVELMRAVAISPMRLNRPRAIERLRVEALRPGGAVGVVAGLFFGDKDWVLAHAKDIVRGTPSAYTTLLLNLALHEEELGSFVASMRDVVPDEHAEAIARERFATRPDQLAACLQALAIDRIFQ